MSKDYLSVMPEDFSDFGLSQPLLKAIDQSGYTEPTPIQAQMIPSVMEGRDVIGQAQTGTGKTAAFALPLLNRLRPGRKASPQILVLAPTRELALQVADSFKKYGTYINNLKVLAIYGGEEYSGQLRQLSKGVNIVVGTPGRVMDHIRRGSLKLDTIQSFILDEADEMLKMGFLEDVEWILEQAPQQKQIALFSATMPSSIRRIAATHLHDPVEITIRSKTATASTINQKFLITNGMNAKKEALGRILEVSETDGVLLFVRTKMQTVELAEFLIERGYQAAPLNGDIPQNQRLRTVEQLKSGKIDILVATDVAARGLDVERVSHVINFDIPFDTESYIHRIGRTGRAGRAGEAILLLAPREKSMLKSIERASRRKIEMMHMPTVAEVNKKRIEAYKSRITSTLTEDCSFFNELIGEYCRETEASVEQVAAALAKLVQGNSPMLLEEKKYERRERRERKPSVGRNNRRTSGRPDQGMERYRIAVGEFHGVKPGNIVGAIANEVDMDSEYIGRISIHDEYSTVDLPAGMPRQLMKVLHNARINGRMMKLSRDGEKNSGSERFGNRKNGGKPRRSHPKTGRKARTTSAA